MDNPNPLSAPSPTPEVILTGPPSPFKKLLKISLIFLGIIILLLAVILTLNYFNILSLSSLYPAQFGFLPHKSFQQTSQKISTSSNTIPDFDKGKNQILSLIAQWVNPGYLVSSPAIQQGLSNEPNNLLAKEIFTATWKTKEGESFFLSFRYNQTGTKFTDEQLILTLPLTFTELTATEAANISNKYLSIVTHGEWECSEVEKMKICENFWIDTQGIKQGVGIKSPLSTHQGEKGCIFACKIDRESSSYNWQSCTSEFAKTGIK